MAVNVKSSAIESVDANTSDLYVTFKDGKTYGYAGAAGHFANICTAPSAGKYFQENVRGKFEFVLL